MKAAALRQTCELGREVSRQNPVTGSMQRTLDYFATVHCFRQTKKEQAALLGKEQAARGQVILAVRCSANTMKTTHLRYEGQLYRIEPHPVRNIKDNTLSLTCTLVNQ